MSRLSMDDMNSLNAIAGYLRLIGMKEAADILLNIQAKATRLIIALDIDTLNRMGDL